MNDEQARASARALQDMADSLGGLGDRVVAITQELETKLALLGETFRDEQFIEFRSAYLHSRQQLDEFVGAVRGFVPVLRQDAEDVSTSDGVQAKD